MQMTGNDLNPVAWLVVKNELADVDLDEVNKLFDHIEREVKPQIMPFYACEGPDGEKGKWTQRSTGKVMGDDFDPLALTPKNAKTSITKARRLFIPSGLNMALVLLLDAVTVLH